VSSDGVAGNSAAAEKEKEGEVEGEGEGEGVGEGGTLQGDAEKVEQTKLMVQIKSQDEMRAQEDTVAHALETVPAGRFIFSKVSVLLNLWITLQDETRAHAHVVALDKGYACVHALKVAPAGRCCVENTSVFVSSVFAVVLSARSSTDSPSAATDSPSAATDSPSAATDSPSAATDSPSAAPDTSDRCSVDYTLTANCG